MGFIYPKILLLFPVLLLLIALWSIMKRKTETRLSQFIVKDNWADLSASLSRRGRFHKGVLILLALVFSLVAAARPYWGEREREVSRKGTNIIFAIDVSDSMRAADVLPSRLEYAKTLVRQILAEIPGNRVGIMPFSGEAFLQCPLTTDASLMQDVLRQMDYSTVTYPGTNIPQVIDTSLEAFDRVKGGQNAIVIITDGEDHSSAILQAANKAAEQDVPIYAIGIGTTDGSTIRMPDGTLKEDASGQKVLSQLNRDILRDLANITDGRAYVPGQSGRLDTGPIVGDLQNLEAYELGAEKRIVREERYQWPLGLALLCLFAEALIGERRRKSAVKKKEAVA